MHRTCQNGLTKIRIMGLAAGAFVQDEAEDGQDAIDERLDYVEECGEGSSR